MADFGHTSPETLQNTQKIWSSSRLPGFENRKSRKPNQE